VPTFGLPRRRALLRAVAGITGAVRRALAAAGFMDERQLRLRTLVSTGLEMGHSRAVLVERIAREMYEHGMRAGAFEAASSVFGPWLYERDAERAIDAELVRRHAGSDAVAGEPHPSMAVAHPTETRPFMSSREPLASSSRDIRGAAATPDGVVPVRLLAPRRRKAWAIVLAFSSLGAALFVARSFRSVPVTVATVERGTAVEAVYATGTVEAVDRVTVKARTSGGIVRLFVREADRVRRGDLLATIDARPLEADLARVRAESRAAARQAGPNAPQMAALAAQSRVVAAELEVARTDLERAQTLAAEGSAATSDLDKARSRVAVLEAQLAAVAEQRRVTDIELAARAAGSSAAADAVAARLADAEVRAPIDGVVLARSVEPGEVVATNQALFRIGEVGRLILECAIDEADIGKVHPGNAAAVSLYAFAPQVFRGTVVEVMPDADRVRKSFLVKIELESPPPGLRSGMSAEVNVVVEERRGALLAPSEAITPDGVAWAVRDGRLERRVVRPGVRGLARVEVLDGLAEGEHVVTSGGDALQDRARVHATVSTPPAQGTPAALPREAPR
jgi:HlyD family secretion protein